MNRILKSNALFSCETYCGKTYKIKAFFKYKDSKRRFNYLFALKVNNRNEYRLIVL